MSDIRRKRVRELVSKMNRKHKLQQKKVDILCNDMVAAQNDFVTKMEDLCFKTQVFESILGATTLNQVYNAIARNFRSVIEDINIAIYLNSSESFEYHTRPNNCSLPISSDMIENCFGEELCNQLCLSNNICGIDEMLELSVQDNLSLLNQINIAAIPLKKFGPAVGFILVYRTADKPFSIAQLKMLGSTASGIAKCIRSLTINVEAHGVL